MAIRPTSDPTDRSMLRDTMTRTIPVAMIATPDACTASVIMFVGWKNLPPLRIWNVNRIAARATSMPNRRRSISVWANIVRIDGRAGGSVWLETGAASATFVRAPSCRGEKIDLHPGGMQVDSSGSAVVGYLQAAGAVAASTP